MESETPSTSSSPPRSHVKKEKEEEIKEFAETAMNELLGWYGYERLALHRWNSASRPNDTSSPDGTRDTTSAEHKKDECSWCNKSITNEGGALQQSGAAFCSELCFSQSRRATFKRAKTCDWCRHVRHTVAYVDFQEGATQLQFCSEKCLNQYKMHIFCRETQAHLDLNPHLVSASSSSNLITPDMWLKNCRSRSASPTSERSTSPKLEIVVNTKQNKEKSNRKKSPLPLITVAPPSKLMKPKETNGEKVQKTPENKKDGRSKGILRKKRISKCSTNVTPRTSRHNSTTPKAQDLRITSPSTLDGSSPTSTVVNSSIHSPTNHINIPNFNNNPPQFPSPMFNMAHPPPMFIDNGVPHPHINDHRFPNMFPPHFMPRPNLPFPPDCHRLPPPMPAPSPLVGQVPPVTVLVPYPVLLPIPFPIPIPLPISAFVQAQVNKFKTESSVTNDGEAPLDYSMTTINNREDDTPLSELSGDKNENITETADKEDENNCIEGDTHTNEASNPEQTLPKFKITRVNNKVAKIVTKPRSDPTESSRPLRKRRRLVEVSSEEDNLIPKTRKTLQV